jgi:hypothetical protein
MKTFREENFIYYHIAIGSWKKEPIVQKCIDHGIYILTTYPASAWRNDDHDALSHMFPSPPPAAAAAASSLLSSKNSPSTVRCSVDVAQYQYNSSCWNNTTNTNNTNTDNNEIASDATTTTTTTIINIEHGTNGLEKYHNNAIIIAATSSFCCIVHCININDANLSLSPRGGCRRYFCFCFCGGDYFYFLFGWNIRPPTLPIRYSTAAPHGRRQ